MSRNKILGAIHQHRPPLVPLPDPWFPEADTGDLVGIFSRSVESNGGSVKEVEGYGALTEWLTRRARKKSLVVHSLLVHEPGAFRPDQVKDPMTLEKTDIAVIPGLIGVAENGAVWVDERCLSHRVLPFICQHLILVLQKYEIVADMHQAYRKINTHETGYGVWIAGPSKTADIEQALVIGAHGAVSHEVMIVT